MQLSREYHTMSRRRFPRTLSIHQPLGSSFRTLRFAVGRGRPRCLSVALLSRSDYLLKILEIPSLEPEEVKSALTLETEAALPADLGAFELAYHPLPCPRNGYRRYEVYVAASGDLAAWLQRFSSAGVAIDAVLPTAVAWRELLAEHPDTRVLLTRLGIDDIEIAAANADGSLSLRAVPGVGDENALASDVLSSLAPFLDAADPDGGQPTIGWIGDGGLPLEGVAVRELTDSEGKASSLAFCLARSLATTNLDCCNLLPAHQQIAKRWRDVLRSALVACGVMLLAMLLAVAAVHVSLGRHRAALDDVESRIAAIRTEGESIGRTLEQLAAIHAARQTRDDFARVLEGLLEATPPGVSYSQIDLRNSLDLSLHGSSSSLSVAFVLPQALERQPAFRQVLLRDAGQTSAATGITAEFSVQCRLARGGTR